MGTGFGKRVPEMSLINSLRRGRESKGGIPRRREREREGQKRGGGGMMERWSGCIKEDEEEKEEIMSRGGAGEQSGEGLWGKDTAAMEAEVE